MANWRQIGGMRVLAAQGNAVSCSSTGSDEVLFTYTVPGGTIGLNGGIWVLTAFVWSASANNKTIKINWGGGTIWTQVRTTNQSDEPLIRIQNRNSLSSQVIQPAGGSALFYAGGNVVNQTASINTAADVVIQCTGNRANGADTLTLDFVQIILVNP